jgi:hypothetical protein
MSEGAGTLDDGQCIIWRLAFDQVYDSPLAIPQSRRQDTRDRLATQPERQGKGLCQRWVVWAQRKVDSGTRGLTPLMWENGSYLQPTYGITARSHPEPHMMFESETPEIPSHPCTGRIGRV